MRHFQEEQYLLLAFESVNIFSMNTLPNVETLFYLIFS